MNDTKHLAVARDHQRRAAGARDLIDERLQVRRESRTSSGLRSTKPGARSTISGVRPAKGLDIGQHGVRRALAYAGPIHVYAAHACLRGEGDEVHARRRIETHADRTAAEAVLLLRQHDDATTLWSFVG